MNNLIRYTQKGIITFVFAVLLAACGGGSSVDSGRSSATPSGGSSGSASTTGSANLSWTAPTKNTDGTNLADLNGYKIYYGTSLNALNSSIVLDNTYINVTTYDVTNLTVGTTYYFAITAVNGSNIESGYSNTVSKNITG